MCKIKSGIVLKDKVFMPMDYDSHEEMIKELGLKDNTKNPDFVRVEITPKDGNIFNHDLENWELQVDQDFKPDWFSKKFAEVEMKKELKNWWKERFIISGKIDKIDKGRWFLGGSTQVKNICGSTQVKNICGSAQVKNICGSAQVENICDSAQVKYIYGSAQVKNICGSAQVKYIYDSAQVKNIYGSAQVENIYDSAQVKNICGRALCAFTGDKATYKTIKENGVAILYYKDNPEIVVANKNIKLTQFEAKK